MSDPLALTFKDVSLYKSDIEILNNRYQWLNDAIISFYFEYISDKIIKDKNIFLMSASTVFMLNYVNGNDLNEINGLLGALKLQSMDIIFIPINNNEDPDQIAGGSHWSLLVFEKKNNKFLYYDSISAQSNYRYGYDTAKKLNLLLTGGNSLDISKRNTPQQRNGYDCGLYLLAITEYFSKEFITKNIFTITPELEQSMNTTITPDYISQKRFEIQDIVDSLIKNK